MCVVCLLFSVLLWFVCERSIWGDAVWHCVAGCHAVFVPSLLNYHEEIGNGNENAFHSVISSWLTETDADGQQKLMICRNAHAVSNYRANANTRWIYMLFGSEIGSIQLTLNWLSSFSAYIVIDVRIRIVSNALTAKFESTRTKPNQFQSTNFPCEFKWKWSIISFNLTFQFWFVDDWMSLVYSRFINRIESYCVCTYINKYFIVENLKW